MEGLIIFFIASFLKAFPVLNLKARVLKISGGLIKQNLKSTI